MQGGMFTVHPLPSAPFSDNRVERYILSKNALIAIMMMLLKFRIDDAFIFPGLDGLARSLNARYIYGFIE